jgi:hypothetical protein
MYEKHCKELAELGMEVSYDDFAKTVRGFCD